ncbi:aminotransferase class I/II-fold pyridoxal phosphate-dependent enzyme [Pedobacter sp. LMG 31464]|uniref:Aminotransferase class I/II-fold pyridoxal phosphate-dependent enzyme n=1 Tax=Pedobacter planticolens TaxID=2679964 RepID=A0A923IW74_9SPHI|nr:aminotransferase class I/II-fold pyridoxal phosphate-dependent enzyme [Pedobacter planticolens]MBB2146806.1 aminotransferase class I/II-fold pyridoxal phosphate-dependent enzyme [Pedobacter planticolens]
MNKNNNIDFAKASFKDFENIAGLDPYEWAHLWKEYVAFRSRAGMFNYRQENLSGCGPEIELDILGNGHRKFVSLVSNDYLGFTQHHKVKAAAIAGIEKFGSGAGASPAIGGHYSFHQDIEDKIAKFFKRDAAIVFTTGYTANSSSLQALLKKEDLAILDMAVHTSVYEGCLLTNVKTFPHNNLEALENVLKNTSGQYRTRFVVVDGVYSQDGDLAPLDKIVKLVKSYGAYLVVDDAHGTGVVGKTGRGVIEKFDLFKEVDIITGTFSKTFAHVGGYLVASEELVNYLKFQSRQHIFSATLSPASACILQAIDLVDSEPKWMEKLWDNIEYLKTGLQSLGLDVGPTSSAIIPVKIGDVDLNARICGMLLEAGIYANQINYPAVSKKDARIRMSVMATHTHVMLNRVLNAWEDVVKKTGIVQS